MFGNIQQSGSRRRSVDLHGISLHTDVNMVSWKEGKKWLPIITGAPVKGVGSRSFYRERGNIPKWYPKDVPFGPISAKVEDSEGNKVPLFGLGQEALRKIQRVLLHWLNHCKKEIRKGRKPVNICRGDEISEFTNEVQKGDKNESWDDGLSVACCPACDHIFNSKPVSNTARLNIAGLNTAGHNTAGNIPAGHNTATHYTAGHNTAKPNTAGLPTAGHNTAGLPTAGHYTAGNNTAGLPTAGDNIAGLPTVGHNTARPNTAGNNTAGLPTAGHNTAGLPTAGHNTARPHTAGHNTAGHNTVKPILQDTTLQDPTLQDTTLQDTPTVMGRTGKKNSKAIKQTQQRVEYRCDICEMPGFSNKTELKRHYETHVNTGFIQCQQCPASFSLQQLQECVNHYNSHKISSSANLQEVGETIVVVTEPVEEESSMILVELESAGLNTQVIQHEQV